MEPIDAISSVNGAGLDARRQAARTLFREAEAIRTAVRSPSQTPSTTPDEVYGALREACTDDDPLVRGHVMPVFVAIARTLEAHHDPSRFDTEKTPFWPVFEALQDRDDAVRRTAVGLLRDHTADEIVHVEASDDETLSLVAAGLTQCLCGDDEVIRLRAAAELDGILVAAHPEPSVVVELLVDRLVSGEERSHPYSRNPAGALPDAARRCPAAIEPEIDRLVGLLDDAERRDIAARTLTAVAAVDSFDTDEIVDVLIADLAAEGQEDRWQAAASLAELASNVPDLRETVFEALRVALLDRQERARRHIGTSLLAVAEAYADAPAGLVDSLSAVERAGSDFLDADPVPVLAREHPEFLIDCFREAAHRGRVGAFHQWVIGPVAEANPEVAAAVLSLYRTLLRDGDVDEVRTALKAVDSLSKQIPERMTDEVEAIVDGLRITQFGAVRQGMDALVRILPETADPSVHEYGPLVDNLTTLDRKKRVSASLVLVLLARDGDVGAPVANVLASVAATQFPDVVEAADRGDVDALLEAKQTLTRVDDWPLGVVARELPSLAERATSNVEEIVPDGNSWQVRRAGETLAEMALGDESALDDGLDALVAVATGDDDRRDDALASLEKVAEVAPDRVERAVDGVDVAPEIPDDVGGHGSDERERNPSKQDDVRTSLRDYLPF